MPPIDTIEVTAHTFQMNTNIARAFEALPETVRLSAYIEFNERKKSDALAFALTFYFGWLGAHHFYLDRIGWGIA